MSDDLTPGHEGGRSLPADPWTSGSPTPPPPPAPSGPWPADPWSPGPPQPGGQAPGPDPFAIVSLVLGLVALPFFFILVVGVAAVVFGGVALSRINRQGRGGKGMAIAGLVLGAVSLVLGALVVLIVMLGSSDDERAITEARPGDCIDLASQSFESVETYTPRDCDAEHELEVVGIVTAVGTVFPGDDALNALADDRCRQLFAGYVGIDFDDSELDLQPLTPTPESWAKGDHEVACVAVGADGLPLTGSVRGSRR